MRNIIRKLAVCFLAWILVCTTVVTGHGMHTAKAAQTFKIHFIDVGCADAAAKICARHHARCARKPELHCLEMSREKTGGQ